jgi:hypothetical protein
VTISIFVIDGNETRTFEKGKIDLTKIGETSIGRMYLEPGWSWEKCMKPIVKTESCQASHTQYVKSGRIRIKMIDGNGEEYRPGDVAYIPPGHNAWEVGNEAYTGIEFGTLDNYAKK